MPARYFSTTTSNPQVTFESPDLKKPLSNIWTGYKRSVIPLTSLPPLPPPSVQFSSVQYCRFSRDRVTSTSFSWGVGTQKKKKKSILQIPLTWIQETWISKHSMVFLLSAIVHFVIQVFQTKAKTPFWDNGYRKVYSSHHFCQMLRRCNCPPSLLSLNWLQWNLWHLYHKKMWPTFSKSLGGGLFQHILLLVSSVLFAPSSIFILFQEKCTAFTSGMECNRRNCLGLRSELHFLS